MHKPYTILDHEVTEWTSENKVFLFVSLLFVDIETDTKDNTLLLSWIFIAYLTLFDVVRL